MRLSTFARLVSAEWNKNNKSFTDCGNEYICITANNVSRDLKYNTRNHKLQEQYDSHCQKYIESVDYILKRRSTVTEFLIDYENEYFHSFENYDEAKWRYRKEVILPQLISYFLSLEKLQPKS